VCPGLDDRGSRVEQERLGSVPESIATLTVAGILRSVAASPDGKFAYVTTRSPNELAVIDIPGQRVSTRFWGRSPRRWPQHLVASRCW
jgi:DNA-binding beta-propeller fold protein YncE